MNKKFRIRLTPYGKLLKYIKRHIRDLSDKKYITFEGFYTKRAFAIIPEIAIYWDGFCFGINIGWFKWVCFIEIQKQEKRNGKR